MPNIQELTDPIAKLNSAELAAVEKLVERLESAPTPRNMTLDQVIDEFEREPSELLQLLAQ